MFPSVYHEFKYSPPGPIKLLGTEIDEVTPVSSQFTDQDYEIMQAVHDIYGEVEGWRLSALTHREGTPWYKCYHEKGGKRIRGMMIDNDEIKVHFKQNIIDKYGVKICASNSTSAN